MRTTTTLLASLLAASGALAKHGLIKRQGNAITVDTEKEYQTIDGFGFSLAFQRANLIVNCPDEEKKEYLINLLFNRETGAGFSIIRNGIGSSGSSQSDWMNTFAPNDPGGPDAEPIDEWDEKDSGQLWVTQQGLKHGLTYVYGNAWSAPGYMKNTGNDQGGGQLCGMGANCGSGDWRQAYADYLVRYVNYYKEGGVNVTHIGFLNEPDFKASYAAMEASGGEAAEFIKILHETFVDAGLDEQVGINCCDSMGWGNQQGMVNSIKQAGADELMYAVTTHTYNGGPSGPLNGGPHLWLSEQCDLNGQWTTEWGGGGGFGGGGAGAGYTWANTIMDSINNIEINAFLYWEGVQWANPNTNEKLITVDDNNDYKITVSKRLWAFANWSRYVRPGAVRVGIDGVQGAKGAAFKNVDGSIAVVLLSTGAASSVSISVPGFTPGEVGAWVTDDSHDCEKIETTLDGETVSGSVAANSITTFWLQAPVEEVVEEVEEVEEPVEESEEPVEPEEPEEPPVADPKV